MTLRFDDEELSAWIDGELPLEEQRALTTAINADPELRRRIEALRQADARVRALAAQADARPLPEGVTALLQIRASRSSAPSTSPPRRRNWLANWPTAIAATLALFAGYGAGVSIKTKSTAEGAILAAGVVAGASELFAALETSPSGRAISAGADAVLTPVYSFQAVDGRHCRKVRLDAAENAAVGLACRDADGWVMRLAAAVPGRVVAGQTYSPASAEAEIVDEAIDGLIDGDPLGAAAEADLIAKGWRGSPME